jgi:hypothetical protein
MSSTPTGAVTGGREPARSRARVVTFLALTGLFIAAAFWTPSDRGLPLCGFKLATGYACPGCGMTRALAALAKGDVDASLAYHAFAPVFAVAAFAWWAALGAGIFTGLDLIPKFSDRRWTALILGGVAVFLAYWIFRLWRGVAP